MFELQDRKVRTESSLFAFFANDTNADIGSQDHAHIVASVSDPEGFLLRIELDAVRDVGLLGWRASTADH
jgi:hypothetical protein